MSHRLHSIPILKCQFSCIDAPEVAQRRVHCKHGAWFKYDWQLLISSVLCLFPKCTKNYVIAVFIHGRVGVSVTVRRRKVLDGGVQCFSVLLQVWQKLLTNSDSTLAQKKSIPDRRTDFHKFTMNVMPIPLMLWNTSFLR